MSLDTRPAAGPTPAPASGDSHAHPHAPVGTGGASVGGKVGGTVVILGVVSMLTDISSEAVNAILPLYITAVLGLSPLVFGAVDALYSGVSGFVRVAGGAMADRWNRPKWVAFAGYAVSTLSRVALLPGAGLGVIVGVVTADRLGKGLRTAPRDAMIVAASRPESLGRAFGWHRALDTLGSMTGPLLSFAVLAMIPMGFDAVFVMSLAFSVLGLAVLGLLAPDVRTGVRREHERPRKAKVSRFSRRRLRRLKDGRFLRLLAAASLLGLLTIGDGFVYLQLQQRDDFAAHWFPLLFVGTYLSFLLLAVPLGRIADRLGRRRVFIAGHVALLGAYVLVAMPVGGLAMTLVPLLMGGAYYAATDGVLPAIAAQLSPAAVRATGIAAVQTAVAASRALASLGFGLLWTLMGREPALVTVIVALTLAIPVGAWLLRGTVLPADHPRASCGIAVERHCPSCLRG